MGQINILDFFADRGIFGRVQNVVSSRKELNVSFYSPFNLEAIANHLAELTTDVNSISSNPVAHSDGSYSVTIDKLGEVYRLYGSDRRITIALTGVDHNPDHSFSGRATLLYFKKAIENMKTPYEALFPEVVVIDDVVREVNGWGKRRRREYLDLMVLQTVLDKRGIVKGFYADKQDYKSSVDRLIESRLLKDGIKFYISFRWRGGRFPVFANFDGLFLSEQGERYLLTERVSNQELKRRLQQTDSVGECLEQLEEAKTTQGSYFVKNAILERGLTRRRDHLALYEGRFGDYLKERLS